MKIFVLGVPHTQTNVKFNTCAYTMKVYNLCRMMLKRGHHVIHLGVEGSDVPCTEHVIVAEEHDRHALYGMPGKEFYNISQNGKFGEYLSRWGARAREAILSRMDKPHSNILACTWGGPQINAVANIPQFAVESGIGYTYTWAKYRVFESYAWMHMIYGQAKRFNGSGWIDTVIPNAFDPEMFEFKENKEDYFLYIGRLIDYKGVRLAIDVAKAVGKNIKIVGQGDPTRYLSDGVEYIPPVGVEERKALMANATCVFCPTYYVEPFGGVNVEAQLSGTPVITTDWGVFPETVLHGITGFRCKTWEQFLWAARNIKSIKPQNCRDWALNNYSLDRVGAMYEEYFYQILALRHEGWYAENPDRRNLDSLRKLYPVSNQTLDLGPVSVPVEKAVQPLRPVNDQPSDDTSLRYWTDELKRQDTYARLVGMPESLDFGSKTILDVGCGPISILKRSRHGKSVGVDPGSIGDAKEFEFVRCNPEEMSFDIVFDEVWLFNCLQHIDNPAIVLQKAAKFGNEIRIFEWTNIPAIKSSKLSEEMFLKAFPRTDWEYKICNIGKLMFSSGLGDEYLALHVVRKSILKS